MLKFFIFSTKRHYPAISWHISECSGIPKNTQEQAYTLFQPFRQQGINYESFSSISTAATITKTEIANATQT